MQKAWDSECGGGVWWDRWRTYKNAITNELFLSLAAELYVHTQNPKYLIWAVKEWKWFNQSGLINNQFLINDGLQNCKNNGDTVWTYNQGVVLGGLVTLYQVTKEEEYLASASQIALAAMTTLVTETGILQESCEEDNWCDQSQWQFKGIFMRNLRYLYQATLSQQFLDFIHLNAMAAWNEDRNGTSFGLKWSGPFDTADPVRQSSALDVFNSAIPLDRLSHIIGDGGS